VLYALLRAVAGMALRWFYRRIEVHGIERIPRTGPVLFVVNHPNALVDALLVGWAVPRRIRITAKATLFDNPVAAMFLSWAGVLPLRRAVDVRTRAQDTDPSRNRDTFRAINEALRRGGAILVFPEGKTHDEPSLAPIKTGAARMALQARDSGAAPTVVVVPIGLTFERKDAPRSRVLVQVGEPIALDNWRLPQDQRPVEALTADIEMRLRAVTLNYSSVDDASRATALAEVIAAVITEAQPLGRADRPLSVDTRIARRVGVLSTELSIAGPAVRRHADELARRLSAFRRTAFESGIRLEDVGISMRRRDAARFLAREGWIILLAGPLAVWGRLNHWIPFHAARMIAMQSVESAADPAMRTIVAGAALVTITYIAQSILVATLAGPLVAAVYFVSLPIAAEVNLYTSDRLSRALRRAHAFIVFRRNPALRTRLVSELDALRAETLLLDTQLRGAGDRAAR
jgi:glycerol-3-phosphate O-acyltransferase/dihydroxyacetone phosphate acyltransferase